MCRCSTRGQRASTPPSCGRGLGDVLLAWENEAFLALDELGPGKFEIVVPSIFHQGRAVRCAGRQEHGRARTTEAASGYLEYL